MSNRPTAPAREDDQPRARITATRPGAPRNGMPARVDYEYLGSGRDEKLAADQLAERVRRQVKLRRRLAAPAPPPAPARAVQTPPSVTPPPTAVAPPEPSPAPRRRAQARKAPVRTPARKAPDSVTPEPPARCGNCGYFRTAPGHLLSCGSDPA